MAPISSIMHRHDFRLLCYLNDWLVLGSTFQELVRARDFLLWPCPLLGVIANLSKSSLVPAQTLDYLGITLETSPLRVFPTLKWVQKSSLLFQEFLSDRLHPASVWRSLLGMMSSMSAIVPGSRLRMRSLQLRLNAAVPFLLNGDLVSWDDGCLRDLRWWSDDSHLLVALSLGDSLRCFRSGLGCGSRRSPSLRLVVFPLLTLFHQPARAPGDSLCDSGISASPPRSDSSGLLGQLYSPGLPAEAR